MDILTLLASSLVTLVEDREKDTKFVSQFKANLRHTFVFLFMVVELSFFDAGAAGAAEAVMMMLLLTLHE